MQQAADDLDALALADRQIKQHLGWIERQAVALRNIEDFLGRDRAVLPAGEAKSDIFLDRQASKSEKC